MGSGAEDHAVLSEGRQHGRIREVGAGRGGRLDRDGQPDVEHLDRAIAAQRDVGGFQIAMHDTLLVRRFQGVGNLRRDRQRLLQRDATARDPVGQRRAFDQFQNQHPHTISLLETVDLRDVGVVQRREHPRFAGIVTALKSGITFLCDCGWPEPKPQNQVRTCIV